MGFQDLDKELLSAMRLVTEDPECRRIFQAVSTEGGKASGWGLAKTLDLEPAKIEIGFARLSDLKILDSSGSGMDGYYYLTPLGFKVRKYFESFSA